MPYIKEVFDVTTFEHAKHVVLTSDPDNPMKFENETNFLIDTIAEQMKTKMDESSIVLDFGCGMGRVSKKLIERFEVIEPISNPCEKEKKELSITKKRSLMDINLFIHLLTLAPTLSAL
jgi:hypothetical protein